MASEPQIQITLVYSPQSRTVHEFQMSVPLGTTVDEALRQSQLAKDNPNLISAETPIGIWGRTVARSLALRDHDRIEIYRPLTVDPKVARRQRFTQQGAKAAGLFSKKREGAKAGY